MGMKNQSVSNNTIQQQQAGFSHQSSLSYPQTNQGQQNQHQQNNRAVPQTQVNLQQQPFSFNQHQQAATPGGFIANPSSNAASSSTGGLQPESNSQQFQQVPDLNFQQSQQAGLNSLPGMIAGLVGLQPGLPFQNNDVANALATFLSANTMQQASVHQQQTVQGGNNLMGFAGIPNNNNSNNDSNINVLLQAALSATMLQQQSQNTVSHNSASHGSSSSSGGAAPAQNNGGGQGAGNSANSTYFNPVMQQNNVPNLDLGLLLGSLGVPQQNQGVGDNQNITGSCFQPRSGQPEQASEKDDQQQEWWNQQQDGRR
jgi:hypothetical protein